MRVPLNILLEKKHWLYVLCPTLSLGARGGAVVEALRYKPEGHEIDSRWCQNFSLT
jgi:hypothetical protein